MGKRVNVLRATITFDIEIDPTSTDSVNKAVGQVNEVRSWAAKYAAAGGKIGTSTNFMRTVYEDPAAPELNLPEKAPE